MVEWEGQRIVIVGAARQGTALARFLLRRGARVVLNDQRTPEQLVASREALADLTSLDWVLGGHPLTLLEGVDLLCLSGGVPLTIPLVEEARRRGIPISNDSQIFLEVVPCKVVGITGSAGKTTTTALVGQIARAGEDEPGSTPLYRKVWVGGNIGSPLISTVDEMGHDDLAVMELSSFQLEIMERSPNLAAVLNVTPNHLDRHATMQAYTAAKARILEFQSADDIAILGRDDPGAWSLAGRVRGGLLSFGFSSLANDQGGAYFKDEAVYLRLQSDALDRMPVVRAGGSWEEVRLMSRDAIALRGEHNLLNVMAACTIAAAAGFSIEALRSGVREFRGIAHRLELVRTWKGAGWYNDSIATAPERAMAAIKSFDEPLVLLAGGRDKNLPWEEFAGLVRRRVDHLIVFGEAAGIILSALALRGDEKFTVTRCTSLKDAVKVAAQVAQPGDVVLLSPGGTSFDEFKDFEERGVCFAQWVRELE
jgi:UDP-N-acetylmuramoylalanine--D-glutamate ligase